MFLFLWFFQALRLQNFDAIYQNLSKDKKKLFETKAKFMGEYDRFEKFSISANFAKFKADFLNLQIEKEKISPPLMNFINSVQQKEASLDTFCTYLENLENLEKSREKLKISDILAYLLCSYYLDVAPDNFILYLYQNIGSEEIIFFENQKLNKFLFYYCHLNLFQNEIEKSIIQRLKAELKKSGGGIFDHKNQFKYIKSLSFYCALRFEETTFCHNDLFSSIEHFFRSNQMPNKLSCLLIWNLLFAGSKKSPENSQKVEFLKGKVPSLSTNILRISGIQSSVKMVLEKICEENKLKFEEEKKVLCYYVDLFVEPNIVIEVNGPFHYVNLQTFRKFGLEEVKYQNLRYHNFRVIEINYLKWFEYDRERKKSFLIDCLLLNKTKGIKIE